MKKYSNEQEALLVKFYKSLDEASQRRYAAIEVLKLNHGGKKYIKELLNTSYKRIAKGMKTKLKNAPITSVVGVLLVWFLFLFNFFLIPF